MCKILYYIGTQNIYYGLSSLVKSAKNLCKKFVIEPSDALITIYNVDESLITPLTKIISDYYHITTMEIFTESDWQELNSDGVMNLLASKPNIDDITSALGKLETTLFWAKNKRNAPEKHLVNHIFSTLRNISMEYNERKKPIEVAIGDVVEVNFGYNLLGEISGAHVHSIVCDIDNDMVYVVPMIRLGYAQKILPTSSITINIPEDINYFELGLPGSVALLRKSKYIRIQRINSKIGVTSSAFMDHLLSELPKAFDFRNK